MNQHPLNQPDYRRSVILTVAGIIVAAGLVMLAISGAYHVGVAHAGGQVAAAAGSGSGSAPPPAATPPVFHDPTTDPSAFVADIINLWHSGGWAAALMLLVVGLLEGAAALGKSIPGLAWLGKGRVSLVIGGATGVAAAALNALVGGGQWAAVLTALVAAALAFWHQAGTDPAKA